MATPEDRSGRARYTQPSAPAMMLIESNKVPAIQGQAEMLVPLGAGASVRTVLNLKRGIRHGALRRILLSTTTQTGTAPATVNLYIFSTDDVATSIADLLEGQFVVYSNVGIAVTGGPLELIVNDVRPEEIDFVAINGRVQVVVEHVGGDGTTIFNYDFGMFGDAKA